MTHNPADPRFPYDREEEIPDKWFYTMIVLAIFASIGLYSLVEGTLRWVKDKNTPVISTIVQDSIPIEAHGPGFSGLQLEVVGRVYQNGWLQGAIRAMKPGPKNLESMMLQQTQDSIRAMNLIK